MLRKIGIERVRASAIAIVNDDDPGAQIHQGKGDSAPGAARADHHHHRLPRTVASEAFLEAVAPPSSIEIVADSAAIRLDRDGVDGTDLGGFLVHRVEQRDDILFERIGDVCARKAGSFDRIEEFRQPPLWQTVDIHQVIETVDPGGREGVAEQCRRNGSHDVGPD